MTPRFSVTSVDLFSPVIFRTLFSCSLPLRYSDTVTSMPMPLTSWKPACGPVGVAVAEVDEEVELHVGAVAQHGHDVSSSVQTLRSAVHWPMRKMTNSAGRSGATPIRQTSRPLSRSFCVIVERSHLHEVGLLGLVAEQRAVLPFVEQEVLDRAAHVGPEPLAVRLEHRPLRALVDRALEVGEVAAQVDVLPLGIGADRARAPQAEAAALEEAEAVDALGVEHVLLRLVEEALEAEREVDDLVGRRLVDGAVDVVARVDAGDEARRRHVDLALRDRIEHADPRVVERGVGRVELRAHRAHLGDRLAVAAVEHRDAVAHALGVADQQADDGAARRRW